MDVEVLLSRLLVLTWEVDGLAQRLSTLRVDLADGSESAAALAAVSEALESSVVAVLEVGGVLVRPGTWLRCLAISTGRAVRRECRCGDGGRRVARVGSGALSHRGGGRAVGPRLRRAVQSARLGVDRRAVRRRVVGGLRMLCRVRLGRCLGLSVRSC